MTARGFVTIATGDSWYYRIARNLLRSYRYYAAEPLPFTLICDRENRYTEEFDRVIILDQYKRSYLDKLCLPDHIPYDETIFVDADCLAYRNLNDFFAAFSDASDFSAFGRQYPADYEHAWFRRADTGEYAQCIGSIPDFIGGVYYLRKTDGQKRFSETVKHILDHYHDFRFRQFTEPADEPVYALAMSVHGYETIGERSLPVCFYPHHTFFESDITEGRVRYQSRYENRDEIRENAYLVHWGSGITHMQVYLVEEYRLTCICHGRSVKRLPFLAALVRIKAVNRIWRMKRKLQGH